MPKHHNSCYRLSEQNLMCIDRCYARKTNEMNCRDCVYYETLRCETLKRRFNVNRPSQIDYLEERIIKDD